MRGRTYGVLSPFVGGDYYGTIIAGANEAAVASGDRLLALQTLDPGSYNADRSGVPDYRRPVAWGHLAGVIVLAGAIHETYAQAVLHAGIPVVTVGHEMPGCSAVFADNSAGVRAAVLHLIEHGHERIAFAGHLAHFDVRERREGYEAALAERGVELPTDLLIDAGDNHESGGELAADLLFAAGMPATAVVCGTDRNAMGLIRRLGEHGQRVPADVAVVGFDDLAGAMYMRPSLSTVRQAADEIGAAAVGLLAELAGQPRPGRIVRRVPTTFVRRDSCGCPPSGLPVTEDLTRYLFGQVVSLQETLNIQHELGIDLLGAHDRDPRELGWLKRTTAFAGCLGLWHEGAVPATDTELRVEGEYPAGRGLAGATMPVSEFPPPELFELADGASGDAVFVVPVRSATRDWGMLAAVGHIQQSTPPGSEMMNQSGALLAASLDRGAMVAALREQEEQLRDAALHDPLTGLPNRVLLADRMRQAALRAARLAGHRFAVLLLDLNGFKAVNDSLGHAAGDVLLIEVAQRLTGLLRESDTVARLGGDEFVVLLDGLPADGAEGLVRDSIALRLTEPYTIDGGRVTVGVSIGVALSGVEADDPDHLLREADAAMYRAKLAAKAASSSGSAHPSTR
ncbi:substrate-binding and GGDEF domain-containing protein [Paractinoplanes lichenicola]|uniref:GGDEF domain-containing protein n=1 Tax=Paractinoplanes lichenicola TaxID=2802976 RepID=A0ABS1W4U4_9ACTN|nr:GGDEF domain-containing protein [Actinoplanes lichenicola]MBL7261766.1 GGDEF domain-containing protein [Actinoplanes lichenicola]